MTSNPSMTACRAQIGIDLGDHDPRTLAFQRLGAQPLPTSP